MAGSNYILRGVGKDGGSIRFVLSSDSVVVGRQGDVKLHHESVSRQHARLELRDDGWLLTDLDSRNGTFVNRAAVKRHYLNNGDVIRFGRVALRFENIDSGVPEDAETRAVTMESIASLVGAMQFRSLVGRSAALTQAMRLAARAAKSDATVLIFGESGTGKELFSRLVYSESNRRKGKFLAVNCSAIESTLLGSTLFGHEKGAFTGADRQKTGLFEEANGGTLFLDEISSMPLILQGKLLRALQEKEIRRVGGTRDIPVDVRVIAASNANLEEAVVKGQFRSDLFYRFAVITIDIPPLRKRTEDILPLARHFVAEEVGKGKPVPGISEEAAKILLSYSWPGNVRELENCMKHALTFLQGGNITPSELPTRVTEQKDPVESAPAFASADGHANASLKMFLKQKEKEYIEQILSSTGGDKEKAAEALKVNLSTLYRKLSSEKGDL